MRLLPGEDCDDEDEERKAPAWRREVLGLGAVDVNVLDTLLFLRIHFFEGLRDTERTSSSSKSLQTKKSLSTTTTNLNNYDKSLQGTNSLSRVTTTHMCPASHLCALNTELPIPQKSCSSKVDDLAHVCFGDSSS
jgi:hypothetical protein